MEITAPLNSTALPSGLSARQSSTPTRKESSENTSSSRRVINTELKFKVYDKNKIAVAVVDKNSGNVIREIPPEKLQQLSAQINKQLDKTTGKSVDQFA